MLAVLLLAQALPEPSVADLGALLLQAITGKQYALLASILVLGAVWLARWAGAKAWAPLGTPRAAALLSALGGTAGLMAIALGSGQPFSLGLLMGCVSTALGASGLWSTAKHITEPKVVAMAPDRCTPIEIANGTCKPG